MRIVILGYTDSEDIIAGINEAGIYQYILKPWVAGPPAADSVRQAVEAQHAAAANQPCIGLELRTCTRVLRQRTALPDGPGAVPLRL